VTEKIFVYFWNCFQSICSKRIERFQIVVFWKKPKNPKKRGKLSKTAETSLRRLKTPT